MSDMDDERKLDEMLAARAVPDMRSNLCSRIVASALQMPQLEKQESWQDWWMVLLQGLVLPRPAVSMACVVLFGMMLGMGLDFGEYLLGADPSVYLQVDEFFTTEFEMSVVQVGDME